MDGTSRIDGYIKNNPELVDTINKFIEEYPQDIMVYTEVVQRAKLSQEEQIIFAKAIANYASTIINSRIEKFLDTLGY